MAAHRYEFGQDRHGSNLGITKRWSGTAAGSEHKEHHMIEMSFKKGVSLT